MARPTGIEFNRTGVFRYPLKYYELLSHSFRTISIRFAESHLDELCSYARIER